VNGLSLDSGNLKTGKNFWRKVTGTGVKRRHVRGEKRERRETRDSGTYVSDVGRKIRGGCELLVFYCSVDVICGVVVLSFERLFSRREVYSPG